MPYAALSKNSDAQFAAWRRLMVSLLAQAAPSTLRRLKLIHYQKSENAGSRGKGQPKLTVRWCSMENPDDDKTSGRQYWTATELFRAVSGFAMAREIGVMLDTDEHCVVFERM